MKFSPGLAFANDPFDCENPKTKRNTVLMSSKLPVVNNKNPHCSNFFKSTTSLIILVIIATITIIIIIIVIITPAVYILKWWDSSGNLTFYVLIYDIVKQNYCNQYTADEWTFIENYQERFIDTLTTDFTFLINVSNRNEQAQCMLT